ncbi:hypothetical protein D4N07_00185 [Enterobacter hormaechei]|nr:hypothetical protein D4N07_00185 [Enterobacter hormaechei]
MSQNSEFASLRMTFAVFGAGILMRPIGAIVLGAYIDKVGRRKGWSAFRWRLRWQKGNTISAFSR